MKPRHRIDERIALDAARDGPLASRQTRHHRSRAAENLLPFALLAAAAIANPGPGVVLTVSNAARFGRRETCGGIAGLAFGSLLVATAAATGAGVLLAASAGAFTAVKLLGAAYLVYLGARLWASPSAAMASRDAEVRGGALRRFVEAVALQVSNPYAILFFLSVLPQFIDAAAGAARQFALLVTTYGLLILAIHSAYAFAARRARGLLAGERFGRIVGRIAAVALVACGLALLLRR